MARTLNLSFRPRSLDQLVGQAKVVEHIKNQVASQRMPTAWMFSGGSGTGKTTLARILSRSLQCTHSEFGKPCDDCYNNWTQFNITEINAAQASGVDQTEDAIRAADFEPQVGSKYRIYIFDEAQDLSKQSQEVLLKYTEDYPETTMWIVCTTEPNKIKRTLKRRFKHIPLKELSMVGVNNLIVRSLKFVGSKMKAQPLVDACLEAGICSPGFVVSAVENYLAGVEADKAVLLESSVDTLKICRAVTSGDWETVRHELFVASPDDARAIRGGVGGYLKSALVGSKVGPNAAKMAEAIKMLASFPVFEDGVQLAGTASVLYKLCKFFRGS